MPYVIKLLGSANLFKTHYLVTAVYTWMNKLHYLDAQFHVNEETEPIDFATVLRGHGGGSPSAYNFSGLLLSRNKKSLSGNLSNQQKCNQFFICG